NSRAPRHVKSVLKLCTRLQAALFSIFGCIVFYAFWENLTWNTLFPNASMEVGLASVWCLFNWRAPKTGFSLMELDQVVSLIFGCISVFARLMEVVLSHYNPDQDTTDKRQQKVDESKAISDMDSNNLLSGKTEN